MFIDLRNNLTTEEENRLAQNLLIDLPTGDLSQPVILEAWKKRAWVATAYGASLSAHKLLQKLKQDLLAVKESVVRDYQEIIIWLYYASFDDLAQDELVDLFKQYDFTLILRDEDGNLVAKVKLRLSLEPLDERNLWREKIYNAMHVNDIVVTKGFIVDGGHGRIANWLKEYDREIGMDAAESLKRVEFENRPNIQKNLDESDRNILKKLLDFYEFVKVSSLDPDGFEDSLVVEADGKLFLVADGKQIDLSNIERESRPAVFFPQDIQAVPPPGGAGEPSPAAPEAVALPLMPDIVKQAQAYLTATNGDVAKVTGELQTALAGTNVLAAAGALVLLALLRRLDDILGDEPSFRALVAQDLEQSGQGLQSEGLSAHPNAPQFLARFLKVILQDNLHINAAEAVAFGGRLGELMALENEMYRRLVITDEQGSSRWNM